MDASHVHTVLEPADFRLARAQLGAALLRMFMFDMLPALLLSGVMATALALKVADSNPNRLKLILVFPLVLLFLGLARAVIRAACVGLHARRRLAQLESRTLRGERLTCAAIDEPFPIRPPKWLS